MVINAVLTVMVTLLLGLLLFLINSGPSYIMLLAYSLISFPIVALSASLLRKAAEERRIKDMQDQLIESLYSITYYRSKGISMHRTILRVASSSKSQRVKNVLQKLANRMRLGETFGCAIANACKGTGMSFLEDLYGNEDGDYDSLVKLLSRYESNLTEQGVRAEQSLQQYSTISMFISTIIPSFVIFAFIGESILSQGTHDLPGFSLVMVLVLPFMYLIWGIFAMRRLIAR